MPAFLIAWITAYGVAAIFGLLLLGVFGLPVPDETLLTFAGVLVHDGHMRFAPTWAAAALGSICGITLNYLLGRTAGLAVVHRYGSWLHVSADDLHRVERWLERHGRWTLTFAYFVPGVRHLTGLLAGSAQLPLGRFARFAYPGAVAWTLTFISLGWYVGGRWEPVLAALHRHLALGAAALAVAAGLYAIAHAWWMRRRRRE
jgi:membrane protein DedA with SNARE-associated domain